MPYCTLKIAQIEEFKKPTTLCEKKGFGDYLCLEETQEIATIFMVYDEHSYIEYLL